jgi:Sec-independent protein translocase protein TatA
MGIADSMKEITEDIITSYDVRVKAVGDLAADTRKTLEGFAKERKKMSKEQAKNLADFTGGLSKGVEDMLKEFQREHKQMSNEQAKSLADFVNNLIKDVGSMVNRFQRERSTMSKELKNKLAKEVKEIETYVKKRLKEFDGAHTEMSEALKMSLAKYAGDLAGSVKKLLGEYAADMKKAANAWQGMSKTLGRSKKGGTAISKAEAKVKVRPVKEAEEEEEEEVALPEMGLEERVLEFIERHPEGVRVSDMEDPLGVARTRLGVIAKRLLEEGNVRKEGNLYFPL